MTKGISATHLAPGATGLAPPLLRIGSQEPDSASAGQTGHMGWVGLEQEEGLSHGSCCVMNHVAARPRGGRGGSSGMDPICCVVSREAWLLQALEAWG